LVPHADPAGNREGSFGQSNPARTRLTIEFLINNSILIVNCVSCEVEFVPFTVPNAVESTKAGIELFNMRYHISDAKSKIFAHASPSHPAVLHPLFHWL
jgi:hypothetical protein